MRKWKVVKRLKKIELGSAVLIAWNDAYNDSSWTGVEDANETIDVPAECLTAGFLVAVGKDQVRVAHTAGPDADIVGIMTIPISWVTDVKILGVSE